MLGNDGKPFKTRAGGTVKLAELLHEAIERAQTVITEKNKTLSTDEVSVIAQKVGKMNFSILNLAIKRSSGLLSGSYGSQTEILATS